MSEHESWVGRRFVDLSPEEQRALLEAYGEPERDYHGLATAGEPPQRDYQPIQPSGSPQCCATWIGVSKSMV